VPASEVAAVVEDCGRKQVYGVIVISSGFSEVDRAGAALEVELVRIARTYGIRLLGPNCLGVINTDPEVRLHATFATPSPLAGPVAVLSESGTLSAVLVEQTKAVGLGISSLVAMGNRADVSGNDLLQYWAADERTEVVLASIESFGNPRRFARIVRSLTRHKPVVTLKGGQVTGEGLPDATASAVLAQTGIIRVDTLKELVDVARVLAGQPRPVGSRVGLVGNSGGALALASAACEREGLDPVEVIDLGLDADADGYGTALSTMLAGPVDSALVLFAPVLGDRGAAVAGAVATAALGRPGALVVGAFFGVHPPSIASGGRAIPVFDGPEDAARAVGRVASYSRWLAEDEGLVVVDLVPDAAVAAVHDGLVRGAGWLAREQVASVLGALGIELVPTESVATEDEAVEGASAIGYPVALKASGRGPLAKTEAGGLALDIQDAEELRATHRRMVERLGDAMQPAFVQAMVEPGIDLAIKVRLHPYVGPILTLGPGGVAGALDDRTDLQVVPVTDLGARRLVAGSRHAARLDDAGRAAVERLVLAVAALADEVPEVAELALDPVIVAGGVAAVTDVRLRVEPVVVDRTPSVRRLG
jgi:acyl-CoA synthetase (NDP forming)